MKIFRVLLMLSFSILLFSCSDDDKNDSKFDSGSLQQTRWNGSLTETYNGNESRNSVVGLIFFTENEAEFSVKSQNATEPNIQRFTYSVDGKILSIQEGITLGGNWLLVHFDKNKMELEQGTSGEDSYKAKLSLTRNN